MQKTIKIQCPAKINLTLKVTGKRPDGFHNIESIMQTINLFDYLTITTEDYNQNEIILSGTSDEIPYNEKNLVYKATKLFLEKTNIENQKISIFIEKNIPIAAGLAGGSTDAAGTLYGLNEIFDKPLSRQDLHELCAKLGSDLNVCLEGGRLKTSGRGEVIEPLPFEEFNLSLIKPIDLGISAKEAYTKFSEKINCPRPLWEGDRGWGKIHHKTVSDKLRKYAKELRNNPTPQERKLWQYLKNSQFNNIKFRRQEPIGEYIADFVSFNPKLIIELDGGQHSENIEYDKKRDLYLSELGFRVCRIWNNDIDKNIDGVGEYIMTILNNPTPYPPPTRGGGNHNFVNDLEWAVIDDYEQLQYIKTKYPTSIMSGSGSTYYIIDNKFQNHKGYWIKNDLKSISYGVKQV